MNKNYLKDKKKINMGGIRVTYLMATFGFIFAALTVFLAIQSISVSAKLAYLETEEVKLTKSNEELNNILIENSSLTSLSKSAESMGFTKPTRLVYTEKGQEVAKLP
jgi:cell division protein FtsL